MRQSGGKFLLGSASGLKAPPKSGGGAGETRTCGLPVPNRRHGPTAFGSILARRAQSLASLLTPVQHSGRSYPQHRAKELHLGIWGLTSSQPAVALIAGSI